LQEIANARKLVATEEFDLLGGTERELAKRREMDKQAETDGGLLGSHAFQDFVIPSKDPIGVKLLRKMGWKPGQGVGARISAAKWRKLVIENSESESEEDYDADITFAPRDSAIIVFAQKRDTFGLGFDPYKNVPDIADIKRARADRDSAQDSGRDSSYNKVGFGVGVLDDDDDDEVYNDVSSTNYANELYDDDFDNDDRITIGRRQKDTSRTSSYKESRESINRTGHDGRLPISGFEHGKSDILHEKWYGDFRFLFYWHKVLANK
jgi:G patch domain-containing protein 1